MSISIFDSSVLNNYQNLYSFFKNSNAVNEVLENKNKPYTKPLAPLNPNLKLHWHVCQLVTAPFRTLSACVFIVLGKLALAVRAVNVAKGARRLSDIFSAGFHFCSDEATKIFKIKNSINAPGPLGQQIYQHPFIPESQITDPEIKKRTFSKLGGIKFNNEGLCRGMSHWFIYLYHKTRGECSDPRRQMSSIGKQFQQGAKAEPALLQSLYVRGGKLLDMKINPSPWACSFDTWKQSKTQLIGQLQNMASGAYYVGLPGHGIAYVKCNEKLSYLFDPNYGIVEIRGDAAGAKLYELIEYSLRLSGYESKEHQQPPCLIYFQSCSKR